MSRTLTQREKVLSTVVGGTVLLFVNYFVIDYFLTNRGQLSADLVRKTGQLALNKKLLAAAPEFEARDKQLRATQPRLENEATAGVQLLNQVQEAARRDAVTVEQPSIGTIDHRPFATVISVTLDTKSTWKSLVTFLAKLQTPEQFIVVETAELQVDSGDPTQMHGKFKLSKWYAAK